ncbi:Transcriptional regulatory protein KdpE [subsurface metagenome]
MSYAGILIVDDDKYEVELLQVSLRPQGWKTLVAKDGPQAMAIIEKESPDLIILDINNLPKINGVEVLRWLREWSQIPVIVLSGRGGMSDKVKCLELGADDYITKPFGVDELIARVKAVLRRWDKANLAIPSSFSCRDLRINFLTRQVTIAGNELRFTPTEYSLLKELVLNAGKVLTYSHLLGKVWGPEYTEERQYLHVFVEHLRAKLAPDPKSPRYIINMPRVGYQFQCAA